MPWQDNSGNRGGGGGRGPWGQPPRGNGGPNNGGGRNDPPDLEDLLQASRQRLKRAFPRGGRGSGGPGGPGGIPINRTSGGLIAAGLVALWLASGVYQVESEELAVVTTFGDYASVQGPGLHWHIPAPVQGVKKQPVLSLRDMVIPVSDRRGGQLSPGLMLTGDKNIVDIAFTVQWRIKPNLIPEQGEEMPGVAQYFQY